MGTGNKYQSETDYEGGYYTGLQFSRSYNSHPPSLAGIQPFGTQFHWQTKWHRIYNHLSCYPSLPPSAGLCYFLWREDGGIDLFYTGFDADPDVTSRLSSVAGPSGVTGYNLVKDNDDTKSYTLISEGPGGYGDSGTLSAITTRAGLSTALSYDAPGGRVTTVTGPFGHKLKFAYDASNRVTQMIAPDGGVYVYAYDGNNNLISVTHPDGSQRRYLYGNASFPNALTGIVDEDGNQFAAWSYDFEWPRDFLAACWRRGINDADLQRRRLHDRHRRARQRP